jgi:hypothetical protein
MKVYNRQTKKWEGESAKVGSLKKPKLCKGNRPHDFVLLVPSYVKRDHELFKEEIEKYYEIEEERDSVNKIIDEKLLKIGIQHRGWRGTRDKLYRCSVCGKQEYK